MQSGIPEQVCGPGRRECGLRRNRSGNDWTDAVSEGKGRAFKAVRRGRKGCGLYLSALHHLQAFPIDTHIRQAMQNHYRRGFPNRRYRGYQGVMQQYIFYYELFYRQNNKEKILPDF